MFPMASMTTRTPSSSSSSSLPRTKFDVFLSFRGEDTRKNFTDHLYDALNRKGIRAFRDDEKLERGKPIPSELLKAIEESRFAIIILSRNYASSRWCLDELAKIVECMKQRRLTVLPVFYDVDPSHVRQAGRGSFAEAFAEYEEHFKENLERVQRWRDALRVVANVAGWHLQHRHASTVIQDIVGKILGLLNSIFPIVSDDLFGIGPRVEKMMNSYLDIGVDGVRFVGICGMGGIGKTTLARAVYERIACQFEANCFLTNVREEAGKHGLVALQKQLLSSTILTEGSINIRDDYEGANVIRNRLCCKRVLIILDDVDQPEQLHALVKKRGWFGRGSRIIVTTRNKRLLIEHDVAEDEIYEARELNNYESLQLFSWKAFKEDCPPTDFVELSKKVLNYAKGLPLALEVLGSSLYRRSVDEWENMLSKLKEIPDGKIQDTLQISFDGLPEVEKNIYLDIACFFKGEDKDRVEDILESCGYHPRIGIDNLINKSLITISRKKLWLHDLLEEMGREIVRRESFEEPGRRSRLWFSEDILHVLKNNTGTKRVEGIVLNPAPQDELHLNAEAFSKMQNLRLLKIHNVHLSRGLSNLSNKLRAMHWHGYPFKSLPMSFSPDKLVELNMPCSHIEQIWKGKKSLHKLKILDLSDSQNLIKTPNFTGAPNLEKLILQGCVRLSEVHPSIGVLKRLILLNLKDCKSLTSLPCNISLDSLEILILSGCLRLTKFPEIMGNMKRLSQLYLDGAAIKELPLSIDRLTSLTSVDLTDCKSLLTLPSVICSLTSLKSLTLSGCSKLDEMPEDLANVEHLEKLDVSGTAIRQVPSSILHLKNLKYLYFRGCKGLPPTWLLFSCLLPIPDIGLVFPTSSSGSCYLTHLDLSCCNLSDGAIPNDLSSLSSLKFLDLSGNKFECIPESISQLSKLRMIYLDDCGTLRSLPKLPSSVLYLWADDYILTSLRHSFVTIPWVSSTAGLPTRPDLCEGREVLWMEVSLDLGKVVAGTILRAGMPKWFNNQNIGSSVAIQLHLDSDVRSNWLGYALYFVFEHHDHESMDSKDSGCSFICHFDTDEGPLKQPIVLHVSKTHNDGPIRIWLCIPRLWFAGMSNNVDKWSCIKASITSCVPRKKVKRCGARLLRAKCPRVGRNIKTLYCDFQGENIQTPELSGESDEQASKLLSHLYAFQFTTELSGEPDGQVSKLLFHLYALQFTR